VIHILGILICSLHAYLGTLDLPGNKLRRIMCANAFSFFFPTPWIDRSALTSLPDCSDVHARNTFAQADQILNFVPFCVFDVWH
jgi:hypothetical protein